MATRYVDSYQKNNENRGSCKFPWSLSSKLFNSRVRRGAVGLLQSPLSSPIIPQRVAINGLVPSSEQLDSGIPLRKFGRHDVKVSALGFGGHHLGDAENAQVAIRLVQEAVDNGITFFDNCWEYHVGRSEEWRCWV